MVGVVVHLLLDLSTPHLFLLRPNDRHNKNGNWKWTTIIVVRCLGGVFCVYGRWIWRWSIIPGIGILWGERDKVVELRRCDQNNEISQVRTCTNLNERICAKQNQTRRKLWEPATMDWVKEWGTWYYIYYVVMYITTPRVRILLLLILISRTLPGLLCILLHSISFNYEGISGTPNERPPSTKIHLFYGSILSTAALSCVSPQNFTQNKWCNLKQVQLQSGLVNREPFNTPPPGPLLLPPKNRVAVRCVPLGGGGGQFYNVFPKFF